jgi:hypothetical protein
MHVCRQERKLICEKAGGILVGLAAGRSVLYDDEAANFLPKPFTECVVPVGPKFYTPRNQWVALELAAQLRD